MYVRNGCYREAEPHLSKFIPITPRLEMSGAILPLPLNSRISTVDHHNVCETDVAPNYR